MRLTDFTDYALRVLVYLGARKDDGLATTGDIAEAYGISENHLTKIVHHLARRGYVDTIRGKGGGMRLAQAPDRINLGEVVRGAEGGLALVGCFRGIPCTIGPACALRGLLEDAAGAFFQVLDRHTLADLLKSRPRLVRIFREARQRSPARPTRSARAGAGRAGCGPRGG